MSARERAHPWWVEPLPECMTRAGAPLSEVKPEPLCLNCHQELSTHRMFCVDGFHSGLLCDPFYATLYCQEWAQ